MRGSVAQQDPGLTAVVDQRRDATGDRVDLTEREPLPVILDRGFVGGEVEHVRDPLAQRMIGHHRIRGSDVVGVPRLASSALPIGFPSRV